MKPLPPPNGPRMAACWGVWGKAGWGPPRDHLSTQVLDDPIHPAASWGGQVPGWYLVQARHLIHRSELGTPTRSCVAILHHASPAACSSFFDRTPRDSIFCHYNLFFLLTPVVVCERSGPHPNHLLRYCVDSDLYPTPQPGYTDTTSSLTDERQPAANRRQNVCRSQNPAEDRQK